jgi:hypothetical protein
LLAQNSQNWQISLITPARLRMMSRCIGWGCKHIWHGSCIHSIHIQGVWEYLYAVNGRMDPPLCHYHHTSCWCRHF